MLNRLTVASLILNAFLAAFLILSVPVGREDAPHRPDREGAALGGPSLQQADAPLLRASPRADDAPDWKERLRQSDLPRHVLVAAFQADFNEQWNRQDAALQKRYSNGEIETEDLALFNLDREIALEAAMREALGEAAFREWDRTRKFFDINTRDLRLDVDEANELHVVRTELLDRLRALERSKLKKEIDPATYDQRYQLAQADYEQALRNLVGFERFNEARDSGIPAYLRRELRGLDISDAQLFQVEEIEGAYGDAKNDLQYEVGAGLIDSVKLDQERETLANIRAEKLHQALGETAYALYRKQQDPRYQRMIDFAPDWQLTKQNVESVFHLLFAHETEARGIKLAGYAAGFRSDELQNQLSALRDTLSHSLTQELTSAQLETLRRNGVVDLEQ